MFNKIVLVVLVAVFVVGAGSVQAQQDPVEMVIEACEPEIETFCSQVTPGNNRLLACFYAHEDKLSGRCNYALYEAAAALEQFAVALTHIASECQSDLLEHCGDVEMGEGRVGSCLLDHEAEVTDACKAAIKDVGLERVEE
jgi:hypothetical protein